MSAPADPLLDQAARLLDELRERCAAPTLGEGAEDLLIGGYAQALALEGARRRLRTQALALSERELGLAARERELRTLLRTLQERIRSGPGSGDESAPQRLDGRLQPALHAELREDAGDVALDGVRADEQRRGDRGVVAPVDEQP